MMTVREVRAWLDDLESDEEIGVDSGGLCLRVVGDSEDYLEIGGLPQGDDR